MIMTTTETVAGKQITEVKGLVTSSIVQSRHIGKDLLAGLKSVVGGELKAIPKCWKTPKSGERAADQRGGAARSERHRRPAVRTDRRTEHIRINRIRNRRHRRIHLKKQASLKRLVFLFLTCDIVFIPVKSFICIVKRF